jgi:hypothetical protein
MSLYFNPEAIVAVPSLSTETGAGGVKVVVGVVGGDGGDKGAVGEGVEEPCKATYATPAMTSIPIIKAAVIKLRFDFLCK